jgi:hypothetical protein
VTKPVLLIDSDILVYRCGYAADKKLYQTFNDNDELVGEYGTKKEAVAALHGTGHIKHIVRPEPVENALQMVNTVIRAVDEKLQPLRCEFYLTGKGNFRERVGTILPYKGQRSPFSKPTHYTAIREHLVGRYGAIIVTGQEADDEIGIRATELCAVAIEGALQNTPFVIVSVDKDLDQLPGWHYNWVTGNLYNVTNEEAVRNFFRQLLTGDAVDNIPGIEGIGPVTAGKLIDGISKPRQLFRAVRDEYRKAFPEGLVVPGGNRLTADEAMLENASLLWLRRSREETAFEWKLLERFL